MLSSIKQDIKAIRDRDPAARSDLEVLLLYNGLHAVIFHRKAHWLHKNKFYFSARLVSQVSRFLTGIEIHPGAKIGRGVLIDHGSGVVIGETAVVGDNCTIYQGVTLGGNGKDKGKRHPTLESGVMVGAGAKILGSFTVGKNSKIASNAVVLQPLPPNSTAVGAPARIIRVGGIKCQFDHVNTPDPMGDELTRINKELKDIRQKLGELEKEKTK